MRNRRRGGGNRAERPTHPGADIQQEVVLSGSPNIMSLDTMSLGVGNIVRRFQPDDYLTAPNVIYRHVMPLASLSHGLAHDASYPPDVDEDYLAIDPSSNKGTALYPKTIQSRHLEEAIWPIIEDIFEVGTGQRTSVSYSDFCRYVAMYIVVYASLYQRLVYNHLAYHFDWTQIFPFTPTVPTHLYSAVKTLEAREYELTSIWLQYRKRLEDLPMFPGIIQEVKRAMTPFVTLSVHPRLMVPTLGTNQDLRNTVRQDQDSDMWQQAMLTEDTIGDLLDYIQVTLNDELATIKSFLPMPSNMQGIWDIPSFGQDVFRDIGWYNSGIHESALFQDTDDPNPDHSLQYWESGSSDPSGITEPIQINFLTRSPQPLFGEMRQATIFQMWSNTLDDNYALASPHFIGVAQAVETKRSSPVVVPLGIMSRAADSTDPTIYRFQDYAHSRFAWADALGETGDIRVRKLYGVPREGMLWSQVPSYAYVAGLKRMAEELFSFNALRLIGTETQGSALRTLNERFRMRIQNTA